MWTRHLDELMVAAVFSVLVAFAVQLWRGPTPQSKPDGAIANHPALATKFRDRAENGLRSRPPEACGEAISPPNVADPKVTLSRLVRALRRALSFANLTRRVEPVGLPGR